MAVYQSALQAISFSHRCFWVRYSSRAKYYTIHRPLRLDVKAELAHQLDSAALARLRQDTVLGHVIGVTMVGALLWRPDGMTRALCFDEDTEQGWNVLQEAAR